MKLYFALLMGMLSTACATGVSKELSHKSDDSSSFLIIATDKIDDSASGFFDYYFYFQEVDLENEVLLDRAFSLSIPSAGGFGSLESNRLKKPKNLETSIVFAGKSIEPGTYAYISTATEFDSGFGKKITTYCNTVAPAFAFVPGEVKVVPIGNGDHRLPPDPFKSLAEAKIVLENFPNITAEVLLSTSEAMLELPPKKPGLGPKKCFDGEIISAKRILGRSF